MRRAGRAALGFQQRLFLGLAVGLFHAVAATAAAAAPGDLDPAFGGNGRLQVAFNEYTRLDAVLADADGRVVVAGGSGSQESCYGCIYPGWNRTIARYEADGELDPSFGDGGVVRIASGVDSDPSSMLALLDHPDGGYMALTATDEELRIPNEVLRLDESGDLISGYRQRPDFPGFPVDGELDTAGRLVAAGVEYQGFTSRNWVVRLAQDGALDPTFAGDGIAVGPEVPLERFDDVAPLADGSLLVAGTVADPPPEGTDLAFAKLDPDGEPDPGFGEGGMLVIERPERQFPSGLIALPNGGFAVTYLNETSSSVSVHLAAFESDGSPLPEFQEPTLVKSVEGTSHLALLPDGRILVSSGYELSAYAPDGAIDTSFGGGDGVVRTPYMFGGAISVGPDGRISRVGSRTRDAFLVVHTIAPGTPDADADGLLDSDDPCPELFADAADGCPRIDREVRLHYRRKLGRFFIGIHTSEPSESGCSATAVRLLRRRHGRTRVIAERSSSSSTTSFSRPLGKGRYFAVAPAEVVTPEPGQCRRVRSAAVQRGSFPP